MKKIKLIHGEVELPAFFPDATSSYVRGVDFIDVESTGTEGLVMNTYHLMRKPGTKTIKSIGGLNKFSGWNKPILTDSGGFQVFSLLKENKNNGSLRNDGIIFKIDGEKFIFTPEKCICAQYAFSSDIFMCLDVCSHPNDDYETASKAVDLTVKWAKRCREQFDKLYKDSDKKPLLFGIVQGGNYKDLRLKCLTELEKIGFDGYGFGGWPVDNENNFTYEILQYFAEIVPDNKIKYAMGIGKPEEIYNCFKMGFTLFDCVIPSREARHNRLYVFNDKEISGDNTFYNYVYILDDKYANDDTPISNKCNCYTCRNHSKAYLRHLIKMDDTSINRLLTIHNLYFYQELMERIKRETE